MGWNAAGQPFDKLKGSRASPTCWFEGPAGSLISGVKREGFLPK